MEEDCIKRIAEKYGVKCEYGTNGVDTNGICYWFSGPDREKVIVEVVTAEAMANAEPDDDRNLENWYYSAAIKFHLEDLLRALNTVKEEERDGETWYTFNIY